MRAELVHANVVVVAQQFNPTIASQLWLVRNNIVAESEFRPGCVFTDMFVQVMSSRFNLLLAPEQIQFIPLAVNAGTQAMIAESLGRLVETLPHTPFRAVGLNFSWHVFPDDGDIHRMTRELFFVEGRPLFEAFDTQNASFGTYASKDSNGFRLRLEAKPVFVQGVPEMQAGRLQLLYNFHRDLAGNDKDVQQLIGLLSRWDEVSAEAKRITDLTRGA